MSTVNWDGDDLQVTLSKEEAVEVALALVRAAEAYPDCDFYIGFADEDGTLKWVVKACPPEAGETLDVSTRPLQP